MRPYGAKPTGQMWRRGLRGKPAFWRLDLALDHVKRRRSPDDLRDHLDPDPEPTICDCGDPPHEDERDCILDQCFPGCECSRCSAARL